MASSDDNNKTKIKKAGATVSDAVDAQTKISENDSIWTREEQERDQRVDKKDHVIDKQVTPNNPDRTRISPKPNPAVSGSNRPTQESENQSLNKTSRQKDIVSGPSAENKITQPNISSANRTRSEAEIRHKQALEQADKTVFAPNRKTPQAQHPVRQRDAPIDSTRIAPGRQKVPANSLTPKGRVPAQQTPVPSSDSDAPDKTVFAVNRSGVSRADEQANRTQFVGRNADNAEIPGDDGDEMPLTQISNADFSDFVTGGGSLVSERKRILDLARKADSELLKNRFLLEKVLGAGGMGVVYKAKDLLKIEAQDRDPYVAIKVLSDEFKSHPEAFIALQRESRKTQRIAHPNIVNVHDFDRDGETVFMTMEYLEGKPLDKLISQYKATGLPEEDSWKILEGICSALIYAHGEKIIHSDFKPGNIFVTSKGIAKVFDFGIARAVASAESLEESVDDKTVFDAGNLGALTPAYASLEMLEGEPPDVRDDIYALGCITYELFTGRHPYNRVHANEAARRNLKPERVSVFSKKQWRVIESALAFKRADRVATVEEFWQQLITRSASPVKMLAVVAMLVFAVVVTAFLFKGNDTPSTFSEDEVRSEIEMKLRLEQYKNNLTGLIESQRFDPPWEKDVWSVVQMLRKILDKKDSWLTASEQSLYRAYIEKIKAAISAEEFDFAERLLANAPRYTKNKEELKLLATQLADALALAQQRHEDELAQQNKANIEQKQQTTQAKLAAQRRNTFTQAMENVNKQLACRSGLNMRDFDIAITKLRSVNVVDYNRAEPNIVSSLASCITKIGRSFPERATESKKFAMRIFPANKIIEGIKIIPKDPCDSALAGLGAGGKRALCRDRLGGSGKGPAMVVIPGKGSIKTFAIGKYEVTIDELNDYCKDSKRCNPVSNIDDDLPATNISVDLAKGYLEWLSSKSKQNYRLPTRAEWIYAARADSNSLDSNRNCRLDSRGIKKGSTLIKASVGGQNKWGLVNHVGNAREWITDAGGVIAAIGGSYQTPMEECNVSDVARHSGQADKITGFRVLREIIVR